jgi:hypothetical protein
VDVYGHYAATRLLLEHDFRDAPSPGALTTHAGVGQSLNEANAPVAIASGIRCHAGLDLVTGMPILIYLLPEPIKALHEIYSEHLPALLETGTRGDTTYVVMASAPGYTQLRPTLTEARLFWFARSSARAILDAHIAGVSHGALSPAHVFAQGDHLFVAGFGLPWAETESAYRAPEGTGEFPADVYAWARTVQHYGSGSPASALPGDFGRLVGHCLHNDPRERPTAGELVMALEQVLSGASPWLPPARSTSEQQLDGQNLVGLGTNSLVPGDSSPSDSSPSGSDPSNSGPSGSDSSDSGQTLEGSVGSDATDTVQNTIQNTAQNTAQNPGENVDLSDVELDLDSEPLDLDSEPEVNTVAQPASNLESILAAGPITPATTSATPEQPVLGRSAAITRSNLETITTKEIEALKETEAKPTTSDSLESAPHPLVEAAGLEADEPDVPIIVRGTSAPILIGFDSDRPDLTPEKPAVRFSWVGVLAGLIGIGALGWLLVSLVGAMMSGLNGRPNSNQNRPATNPPALSAPATNTPATNTPAAGTPTTNTPAAPVTNTPVQTNTNELLVTFKLEPENGKRGRLVVIEAPPGAALQSGDPLATVPGPVLFPVAGTYKLQVVLDGYNPAETTLKLPTSNRTVILRLQ